MILWLTALGMAGPLGPKGRRAGLTPPASLSGVVTPGSKGSRSPVSRLSKISEHVQLSSREEKEKLYPEGEGQASWVAKPMCDYSRYFSDGAKVAQFQACRIRHIINFR